VLPFDGFDSYTIKNPYTAVILAPSATFQHRAFNCVLSAAKRGVSVYAMPTVYEILLGRLQHLRINDLPMLELRLNPSSSIHLILKRVFDFTLALILLLLLSLPMLIIGVIVKLNSDGSALYSQMRVGYLGREFRIYKFRSMSSDAEKLSGAVFATKGDSRVTSFGRFIRSARLDELPQLWNILTGDMSFVGPRPERPVFVMKYEADIEGYSERHRVRPGVTGLAQVSGSYNSSADVKLKYDLAYISNQNFALDIQILFRTIKTVFTRVGQ
jgi:exopolysaccharide biosynthesis polyprenyl glycosylphosphotransferase